MGCPVQQEWPLGRDAASMSLGTVPVHVRHQDTKDSLCVDPSSVHGHLAISLLHGSLCPSHSNSPEISQPGRQAPSGHVFSSQISQEIHGNGPFFLFLFKSEE